MKESPTQVVTAPQPTPPKTNSGQFTKPSKPDRPMTDLASFKNKL